MTIPIIDIYLNDVLAVIQSEYNYINISLNINDSSSKEIKYFDQEVLNLFCSCMAISLSNLRNRIKK